MGGLETSVEVTAGAANIGNPALNISNAATAGVISSVKDSSDLDQSGARAFRAGIRLEW